LLTSSTLTPQETPRIRWACRRGMRELDVILLPYFEKFYETLPLQKQEDFIALLDSSDQDLWRWFFTEAQPESAVLHEMVLDIKKTQDVPTVS